MFFKTNWGFRRSSHHQYQTVGPSINSFLGAGARSLFIIAVLLAGLATLILLFPAVLAIIVAGSLYLICLICLRAALQLWLTTRRHSHTTPHIKITTENPDDQSCSPPQ